MSRVSEGLESGAFSGGRQHAKRRVVLVTMFKIHDALDFHPIDRYISMTFWSEMYTTDSKEASLVLLVFSPCSRSMGAQVYCWTLKN